MTTTMMHRMGEVFQTNQNPVGYLLNPHGLIATFLKKKQRNTHVVPIFFSESWVYI